MKDRTCERDAAPMTALAGVHPALVVDRDTGARPGRVRVHLPALGDDPGSAGAWARVAVPLAGPQRGAYFLPEIGDEVLVAFAAGDASRAYVIGALWNAKDAPPVDDAEADHVVRLRSRGGAQLTFDDSEAGRVSLETADGARVELDDASQSIEVRDASGNRVHLSSDGVHVEAVARLTVNATTVEVGAAMVTVTAPLARFNGVVQCETLISSAVVASSYTPGAGNIW